MCSAGPLRFEAVPPEPARFWIRNAPRSWPGPDDWWIDIARAEPATERMRGTNVRLETSLTVDDLVYVPPVQEGSESVHRELLQRCSDLGVPTLQQVLPHQAIVEAPGPSIIDLTGSLLDRRLEDLLNAKGSWALWPLIPGLTDGAELVEEGLGVLAGCGATGVLPVVPALTPMVRRQLAELGSEELYSVLFHKQTSPRRADFARRVAGCNLRVYPTRPSLADSRRAPNRALAAHFALLAELWLGCGRPEGRAHVYFSLARRLDEEPVDVAELARRGGLSGIGWLDDDGRSEIRAIAGGGQSDLLAELEREHFGQLGNPG